MTFFGTNIKKIRQVKGLSQKAFADLLDLNRGVISSYEEGRAEPKIETILKVADHFNIDLDKLLTETLQTDQLLNVSGSDQLMLFPEITDNERNEISLLQENRSSNHPILQKILASVDLIHEFTSEKQLIPQYHYGDILFLNKANPNTDPVYNLFVYIDGNLQYASRTDKQDLYKIVGQISFSEKNIFSEIFKRLENLERKG
ncbi:helix-turn-helix domain-containing protein [Chryseobacterium sp.]|uniref:helix-turn-helix domain-containing protein n=1 Tax=Chryseobacterium sp. TaxID=1871047 RepID=UPI002FC74D10